MAGVTDSVPLRLLTDKGGVSQRLRVDDGSTGFFAGRVFRSYLEQIIPTAGPAVIARFTSPIDFILLSQTLTLTQGALRAEIFVGATSTGAWTSVPVIGVNRMSERPQPFYTPQVTVDFGLATVAGFTGGTAVDLILLRASAQNASAQNVSGVLPDGRGLPAGVYHIRFSTLAGGLTVNDAAQMVYAIEWEERV